jgi:diguanylate cyclase (GGDEF)-like protein
MRNDDRPVSPILEDWQLPWLLVLTLALFIFSIGSAVVLTTQKISTIENGRTKTSIEVAIKREIDDLAKNSDDNSIWDDAALSVYRDTVDMRFAEQSWASATRQKTYFDRLILLNKQGDIRLAYHNGLPITPRPESEILKAGRILAAKLTPSGPAISGIVKEGGNLYIIAASVIRPSNPEFKSIVPKGRENAIVVVKPLSHETAAMLANTLQLPSLQLVESSEQPQSLKIFDLYDKPVGALIWPTTHSGTAALRDVFWWIIAIGMLNFIIGVYLWHRGMRVMTRLGNAAMVDTLSQLPNRRALRERLDAAHKNGDTIGLALLDLDGFKPINDNYGHDVGDELIRICGRYMRDIAGEHNLSIRLGGDEFAVFVAGPNAAQEIEDIARKLIGLFSTPIQIGARTMAIGTSIGLASGELKTTEPAEIMRRADIAMYESKKAGKMRYTWFDDAFDKQRTKAQKMAHDLRLALQRKEFSMVYQPVFDARTSEIISVEALLRWTHPEHGPIAPSEFLPIADKTGLIMPIGREVLNLVVQDCAIYTALTISLNLSPAQARAPDYVERLQKGLTEVGITPDRIQIEIGEKLFLADAERNLALAQALSDLSIDMTLDNFGAGAAALNALRNGGFSRIKLSGSLVKEAEHNPVTMAMLQSAVNVAHAQRMHVTAEGVETEAQADLMRVLGCDALQGWLYGQAVDGKGLAELYGARNVVKLADIR